MEQFAHRWLVIKLLHAGDIYPQSTPYSPARAQAQNPKVTQLNTSKKLSAAFGIAAFLSIGFATGAEASGGDKVFVCKYVGTPGVDERLQTGQNPISVSVSAISDSPVAVGSEFADKHIKSVVIAFDEGQPEPSVSACPAPAGPTTDTTVPPTTVAPLIEVIPPAPQPVDQCGTTEDGVIVPPATEGYSYVKLVDGFHGGDLTEGFNAYTGSIIVSVNEGYLIPGGNQTVWSFEFSDEPCSQPNPSTTVPPTTAPVPTVPTTNAPQPVVQEVAAAIVMDCHGAVESGFVVFKYAEPVLVIMDILQGNGQKGGMVYEGIGIQPGTVRYDFEPAVINAVNASLATNPNLPTLSVYLTTLKGGDGTFHEFGFLLSNEPCVAVGQPPVPTTTVPPTTATTVPAPVGTLPATGASLIFWCLGIGSVLVLGGYALTRKGRPVMG